LNVALTLFSAVSFLFYGFGCFASRYLKKEFERYGFSAQRGLIGSLQILGALGQIGGLCLWLPLLGKAAAAGLALMMLVAIGVRIRIRDTPLQIMPAVLYFLVNAYLTFLAR
jgi:uncharacterized membrane protein YphA (DoxX/SURF4 family)